MSPIVAVADGVIIYGTYAVSFGVLGLYTWFMLRRGRELADEVDDAEKYWK